MVLLNLCEIANQNKGQEILFSESIVTSIEDSIGCEISRDRVYLGSYFCGQLFLMSDWNRIIEKSKQMFQHATLCVPVFSEQDLDVAKRLTTTLISNSGNYIDEVSVNDFGMAQYLRESDPDLKIHFGRLLFKYPRDIRLARYEEESFALQHDDFVNYLQRYDLAGFEIDQISKNISFSELNDDKGFCLSMHAPLCYMTTGNICKYASINKPLHLKFRPNLKCEKECSRVVESYHVPENPEKPLYRLGRTIYFYSEGFKKLINSVDRLLYFPAFEFISECRGEK